MVVASLRVIAALALSLPTFVVMSPACAQQQNPQNIGVPAGRSPSMQQRETIVPLAILAEVLNRTPETDRQLRQYLASNGASAEEITSRAVRLIRQLKGIQAAVDDPKAITAAADHFAELASESLNATRVMQLKIDKDFKVPEGAYAFDFGPADKPRTEGFQRVHPNDPMVRGKALQGVHRPGDGEPILSGGIAGVEGLSVSLPNGEYRVILITESFGNAETSLAPFGQKIVANGQERRIFNTSPDDWLHQAVLSRRGIKGGEEPSHRHGGAVMLTAKVDGGKLDIGFGMDGAETLLKTYLVGLVIQPIEQEPILARTQDADPGQWPVDRKLSAAAQISSAIADLLQSVRPPDGFEFGPPVTEPNIVASPS